MALFLKKETSGLFLIDAQERLMPHIPKGDRLTERLRFVLKSARLLKIPLIVSEQSPQHLGQTLQTLKEELPSGQPIHAKTTFSGYSDPFLRKSVERLGLLQWILVGLEAHICVLQTAKELLAVHKEVVVLSDAIGSRDPLDKEAALEELRFFGARVTTSEALLYELVRDSKSPHFPEFLSYVKQSRL